MRLTSQHQRRRARAQGWLVRCAALVAWSFVWGSRLAAPAWAQPVEPEPDEPAASAVGAVPRLAPPPDFSQYLGRRIARIDVVVDGGRWLEQPRLARVRVGETLTAETARRALQELTDTGRFATATAHAETQGADVRLVLRVLPRRIATSVRVRGDVLDGDRTLDAADVAADSEVTALELQAIAQRVRDYYARRGYPGASVRADALDTDDPMRVVVVVDVTAGPPAKVTHLRFQVSPSPDVPGLSPLLRGYDVSRGDRIDEEVMAQADRDLEKALRGAGWHRAVVQHRGDLAASSGVAVTVRVDAGPLVRLRFEGNQLFDASQLELALDLENTEDRSPPSLLDRLRDFYVQRGLLDVEVSVVERGGATDAVHDLVFTIRENRPVRVVAREYPCLSGGRSAAEVGSEIDSFLSEGLPGGEFFGPVDGKTLDRTLGPTGTTGSRPRPYELNPWVTYVPEVYERAMKHVQDLYRSEGYLSASVGPAEILRRRCQLRSPPGQCVPLGPRRRPQTACVYDEIGVPLEEPPPDPSLTCAPDPARHVSCEPDAVLHIPIKLGPRTFVYDVAFEGNRVFVERELEDIAALQLGQPVSLTELENASRRLLDAYAERGFAYAEAEAELELSPDRTRARVRFSISEREQVRVSRIIVRGAKQTREGLIRSRIALTVGDLYRRSDVRKTEERLATLGVFSSVTVGLDDPYVPAREKAVVVTVVELMPQYVDIRPGFSTGEGFRITFEYGHRNLLGEAIQLTLRVQLGYLPDWLIFEQDVQSNFSTLDGLERLERRNTATLEFPEIGLGPLFRLSVEGVDLRDLARDFALTKDAGIVTLTYRPERRLSLQVGGSLERNDANIFDKNEEFSSVFLVPSGESVAVAQRVGVTSDQRDNPLEATSGTLFSLGVEHVNSYAEQDGNFLHYTGGVSGYLRLSRKGLAVATTLRWGFNQQLRPNSKTYPDRLFFLGGIDSLRGFLQDSVIPEDIAQLILDDRLELDDVAIRGGNFFVNPRAELRIPLGDTVRTALFVDAGNLWAELGEVRLTELRYAVGTGLRVATPIGPLVFDYGFNVERVMDAFDWTPRENRRFWEEIGAFHFSVGLF